MSPLSPLRRAVRAIAGEEAPSADPLRAESSDFDDAPTWPGGSDSFSSDSSDEGHSEPSRGRHA